MDCLDSQMVLSLLSSPFPFASAAACEHFLELPRRAGLHFARPVADFHFEICATAGQRQEEVHKLNFQSIASLICRNFQ
jgi:hypothetical protein